MKAAPPPLIEHLTFEGVLRRGQGAGDKKYTMNKSSPYYAWSLGLCCCSGAASSASSPATTRTSTGKSTETVSIVREI